MIRSAFGIIMGGDLGAEGKAGWGVKERWRNRVSIQDFSLQGGLDILNSEL